MQNLFDSHAHYDAEQFDGDRDAVLRSLPGKGVAHVLNAGTDMQSSGKGIALAEKYGFVYAAAGMHPHEAAKAPKAYIHELAALCAHQKVVAVGEIGLDYHYDFSPRETQLQVFREQLELARDLNLPVIIHDRKAHGDTLRLLREFRPRGIVHCFSGSAEMAREVAALGMYVGFTGAVTFKNARKALEAARAVPEDRILLETDCPYMAPEPHRGKRCDSSLLVHTAAALAAARGMDAQRLVNVTCQNARAVYGIQ